LSDAAIFFALVSLKTPRFRSSASLSRVTRCDHRFGDDFFAVVVRLFFRAAVLRGRVVFRVRSWSAPFPVLPETDV
jgi:hypothetical protein